MPKLNDTTFSLMFEFGRVIRARMSRYPSPSLPQLEALHHVNEHPRESMRALAAHLKIKAPSATALVDELVRARLIRRERSRDDRRAITLALTPQGSRVLRQSIERRKNVIGDVLSPLPERDRAEFNRILEVIVSDRKSVV